MNTFCFLQFLQLSVFVNPTFFTTVQVHAEDFYLLFIKETFHWKIIKRTLSHETGQLEILWMFMNQCWMELRWDAIWIYVAIGFCRSYLSRTKIARAHFAPPKPTLFYLKRILSHGTLSHQCHKCVSVYHTHQR